MTDPSMREPGRGKPSSSWTVACRCLHHFFQEQVATSPGNVALLHVDDEGEQTTLTYGQLDSLAENLAAELVLAGVGPDTITAVSMPRGPEQIMSVLAVLKAGGAYAPIDPGYPEGRVQFMLRDSGALVLLTRDELQQGIDFSGPVICPQIPGPEGIPETAEPTDPGVRDDHLAYVIYTSGSTGRPKGVAMEHGPLVNLMNWQIRRSAMGIGCRTLQFASLSFDVSCQEIFSTLGSGGILVLVPESIRRDSVRLLEFIDRFAVNRVFLPFVALHGLAEAAQSQRLYPSSLKEVVTAGEPLVLDRFVSDFFQHLPDCLLENQYGPSETHVVTAFTVPDSAYGHMRLPPIGQPIDRVTIHILDEDMQPVPDGTIGELYVGGASLARGYLNRPERTERSFVRDPFHTTPAARLYRTGDMARCLADGNIEFLGRIDHQVKIRGYRVETGEVEAVLAEHPGVTLAVVGTVDDHSGRKRLVAWLTTVGEKEVASGELRAFLLDRLPDYMIPSMFIMVSEMPRTPSGKIDRKSLPLPTGQRPLLEQAYIAPRTAIERRLAKLWAQVLELDNVGIQDNFFELGGDSLLAQELVAEIQDTFQLPDLIVVRLFQYSTVAELAAFLEAGQEKNGQRPASETRPDGRDDGKAGEDGIAVIGMACRLPGAENIEQLWCNLCEGVEATTFFSDSQLDPGIDKSLLENPHYVKAKGIIADVERFDAEFFGIHPREAEMLDPQQRIFLELAWTALEHAGYATDRYSGSIGVYAGAGVNTYYLNNVLTNPERVRRFGEFQAMVANEKDYLATRVAHKLNLRGPAISLYTACSTSLVAVSEAFYSLRTRQCDMALAGGVSVTVPQNSGYLYQEGGMLSDDGHCRPFDEQGRGTVFSNGAGIVVLKRLQDALADRDTIYAVIQGAATNNDGAGKVSFAAPSVSGQVEVIARAQECAGIAPESISYVEAHGTATPLGDPIEIEALTQAFRRQTSARQFCAIGSIKSNFGHVIAAAGVAGLIKTVLALHHGQIPPSLHFRRPNKDIDFANSPFFVNTRLVPWQPEQGPRRAGVSSFGLGGTNAHVVLEEAPAARNSLGREKPARLVLFSAKNSQGLQRVRKNLAQYMRTDGCPGLRDIAYTLQVGRSSLSHRGFVVSGNCRDAAGALTDYCAGQDQSEPTEFADPPVVFMFPGQGAQHLGMAEGLYRHDETFRQIMDQGAELLESELDLDLRELIFSDDSENEKRLNQTSLAQPALFLVEYALAGMWRQLGVEPAAMIGHSIGEFTAACLAGVFSFEACLWLVARRGALMQQCPEGCMLSVRFAAEKIEQYLSGSLVVSTVNSPGLCVVGGPGPEVAGLEKRLKKLNISCRLLRTSHAFHTPAMETAAEDFVKAVEQVEPAAPAVPFISCVTGTWITGEQATNPGYWGDQIRNPVQCSAGIARIIKDDFQVLLEVGPRTVMTTLARQHVGTRRCSVISTLGQEGPAEVDYNNMLAACGRLWQTGVKPQWSELYQGEEPSRVPLPTYPFAGKRYWLEPDGKTTRIHAAAAGDVKALTASTANDMTTVQPMKDDRKLQQVTDKLRELIHEVSGIAIDTTETSTGFLEQGFDSLLLTQVATTVSNAFSVEVLFRQLMEELGSVSALARYISCNSPVVEEVSTRDGEIVQPAESLPLAGQSVHRAVETYGQVQPIQGLEEILARQLEIIDRQLDILTSSRAGVTTVPEKARSEQSPVCGDSRPGMKNSVSSGQETGRQELSAKEQKMFGPGAKIATRSDAGLDDVQQRHLDELIDRYTAKTAASKRYTAEHRSHLADPRAVSGFQPLFKELIYPIVVKESRGVRLTDIDGNEYIDLVNGFGSNFFGFTSELVMKAVAGQMSRGVEIGPQHPLAGEVAGLLAEMTGLERFAFCNTGSEAVLGCTRLARTVTGRKTIAIFAGAYHGIFDEVIVRGTPALKSIPGAPGIMPEAVDNTLVLEYGAPESLDIIRQRGKELAAVLVEPVQSRNPALQPGEFLGKLREITRETGTALIMDEVITGFRIDPGGAQAYFGVQGDLATYGKVIGGGLPIGVIGGSRKFMDALDGGTWQYGDDSLPEVGVTYFAGTFVRHPMALAAARAVLGYLKEQGRELQKTLNLKSDRFAHRLNSLFQRKSAPMRISNFGSLMKVYFTDENPLNELVFCYLREKGLHIWDGRPIFLTLAHSDEDIERIIGVFGESVEAMQTAGFFQVPAGGEREPRNDSDASPVPGARLGRTPEGKPAWFIADPDRPGKYIQLDENK